MLGWLKRKAPPATTVSSAVPAHAPDRWAGTLAAAAQALAAGDTAQCERLCREALAAEPEHARALTLLAKALARAGATDEAVASAERASDAEPDFVDAHMVLGGLYKSAHRLEDARDHFELAAHYAPESTEAHVELAGVIGMQGDLAKAEAVLTRALELEPGHVPANLEMVAVLERSERFADALPFAERAVESAPEALEALNALRFVLFKLERWDEALPLAAQVVARTPDSAINLRLELGNCFLHLGRFEEAAEMFDHVLKYEPNSFDARLNRAHYRLASEMFPEGWADYRYRFHSRSVALRAMPFPEWRGDALEGKTLLIYAEQGLGDEIMFASCFPDMIARAKHCVIECEKRLEPLFRRSFPTATVVPATGEHEPPWLRAVGPIDYQVAAGDLPSYLRNDWKEFPRHTGYLKPDPEKVARWRARLDALGPGLKIGISWRGGTQATRSSVRTISLPQWLPLLGTPGCKFVSLQYGKVAEELAALGSQTSTPIVHWQDAIEDYDETAALVCALDLVLSVCTALIHLTGALGRPVWVMVPAVPEWRYLRKGEALPWYPAARLFRQADLRRWSPVVDRVQDALADLAAGPSRSAA